MSDNKAYLKLRATVKDYVYLPDKPPPAPPPKKSMQRGGIIKGDAPIWIEPGGAHIAEIKEYIDVDILSGEGLGTVCDVPRQLAEEARKSAVCKYCGMKLEKCGCGYH